MKREILFRPEFKDINDNKRSWNNIKHFFSNKGTSKPEITLIERENIISDDLDVANTVNNLFENDVKR